MLRDFKIPKFFCDMHWFFDVSDVIRPHRKFEAKLIASDYVGNASRTPIILFFKLGEFTT